MKLATVKRCFKGNPGALFIVAFQILVFACAFLLVQGNPAVNNVGILAYCFLVVGVVLQAIGFIRAKATGERT